MPLSFRRLMHYPGLHAPINSSAEPWCEPVYFSSFRDWPGTRSAMAAFYKDEGQPTRFDLSCLCSFDGSLRTVRLRNLEPWREPAVEGYYEFYLRLCNSLRDHAGLL